MTTQYDDKVKCDTMYTLQGGGSSTAADNTGARVANLFNDKVCLDAFEGFVGLLLKDKDDIARLDARLTVARLSPQYHLGVVLVPLLYVHLKDLLLWQQPL